MSVFCYIPKGMDENQPTTQAIKQYIPVLHNHSILNIYYIFCTWFYREVLICFMFYVIKFSFLTATMIFSYAWINKLQASLHFMIILQYWYKLGEFTMVSQPIRLIRLNWFVFHFCLGRFPFNFFGCLQFFF